MPGLHRSPTRTAYPASRSHSASKVRSATVIGPYATRTDGLSKTAFVLGPDKAMEIYKDVAKKYRNTLRELAK